MLNLTCRVMTIALALVLTSCELAPTPDDSATFPEASRNLQSEGWFLKQLEDLREPSLRKLPSRSCETAYRFTLLRSFSNPLSVRIEHNVDRTTLVFAKELGARGSGQMEFVRNDRFGLNDHAVRTIFLQSTVFAILGKPISSENPETRFDGRRCEIDF